MRLQKQKTREVKGKEYFGWSVVMPPDNVSRLGWREGDNLEATIVDDGMLMRKTKKGRG